MCHDSEGANVYLRPPIATVETIQFYYSMAVGNQTPLSQDSTLFAMNFLVVLGISKNFEWFVGYKNVSEDFVNGFELALS